MASWSLLLHLYLKSYRSFGSILEEKAAKKSEAETSKGARLQAHAGCSMTFSKNSCDCRVEALHQPTTIGSACAKPPPEPPLPSGSFFIARQGPMHMFHRCMPAGFEFLPIFAAFLSFRSPLLVVPLGLLTRKLTDIILGAPLYPQHAGFKHAPF